MANRRSIPRSERTYRVVVCTECGVEGPHEALGKCRRCYKRAAAQRPTQRPTNLARSAAWNEANREKTRAYFVDRMASDLEWAEKRRAHYRAMVARDRTAEVEKVRRWRKANPEHKRVMDNTRRARQLAIPSDLTAEQWGEILADAHYRCSYCGIGGKMTMDHVIPLSRGGHHTASNVTPACQPCNNAKGASTAEEFLARRFRA